MIYQIKPYEESQFDEICSWWLGHGELPPPLGWMVEDGTFCGYLKGVPSMTLTAFKTQSKEMGYIHGYCAKPLIDRIDRRFLGDMLWKVCEQYLKEHGFKRSLSFSNVPALIKRYENLGMKPTLQGLTAMVKEF